MANLDDFSRRIHQRALEMASGVEIAAKETALVVDQVVVTETPVDTGRARANWQVGIGQPVNTSTIETDDSQSAGPTLSRNEDEIERWTLADENIHLTNNIEYITPLNEGSSAQAPAGFVETAILEGLEALQRIRIFRGTI